MLITRSTYTEFCSQILSIPLLDPPVARADATSVLNVKKITRKSLFNGYQCCHLFMSPNH